MILKKIIHYPDTNSVEATWVDANDIPIRCHSYADSQLALLESDLGAAAAAHADMLALVRANIQPYVEPPPVIPDTVLMYQARLALLAAGITAAMVEAVIATLPEPYLEQARIQWEYSPTVKRHNGFVAQIAPALGLSASQQDQLFIDAAGL